MRLEKLYTPIFIIPILLFTFACTKKSRENIVEKPMDDSYSVGYNNKIQMTKLLNAAILKGDTTSYKMAYKNYTIASHYEEFLYYSISMAEKHDYNLAYYHTYELLKIVDEIKGYNNIHKNNPIAIYFLLMAYEKNEKNALDDLMEIYSNKSDIPKSSDYLKN